MPCRFIKLSVWECISLQTIFDYIHRWFLRVKINAMIFASIHCLWMNLFHNKLHVKWRVCMWIHVYTCTTNYRPKNNKKMSFAHYFWKKEGSNKSTQMTSNLSRRHTIAMFTMIIAEALKPCRWNTRAYCIQACMVRIKESRMDRCHKDRKLQGSWATPVSY